MALTGVHVACVRAGIFGNAGYHSSVAVAIGAPVWSENVTSAGAGTRAAPAADVRAPQSPWVFIVHSAVDAYVAVGATPGTPSATNGYFVPAAGETSIAVNAGDTWAWTDA